MKTVNALQVRNQLGGILDDLEEHGEPILVSKGRRVRAVLITPEDFQRRFLDKQAEERRQALVDRIQSLRGSSTGDETSIDVLRQLRGY